MAELVLTDSGNDKRKNGSNVLYQGDVESGSRLNGGAVVDLVDQEGNFRGRGFFSGTGSVAVHVLSNRKIDVDETFFERRITTALESRQNWMASKQSYRLINSEGDFLPGLVVDRFGDLLSIQLRSKAMDRRADTIVGVLEKLIGPDAIYHRADLNIRDRLGLSTDSERLMGSSIPDLVEIQRKPYSVVADIKNGQKTGAYLDQALNRQQLEQWNDPGRSLDCFCYAGEWGLALLHAGASHVTFVDRSARALELVEENVRRNGWSDRAERVESDGFDYLEESLQADSRFDSIVLDPPAFVKSNDNFSRGRAGYKGINFRAMRLLKPEGKLATSSCSHPVDMDTFTDIIRESAHDAHVDCQVMERRYQSPDHPWLVNDPRSRYLTCVFAQISLV